MTLQPTAAHCNSLQHTATLCNTLQHTATHCNTLQRTATHCNALQHTATHCVRLRHTVTHCSTLQHTATHCSVVLSLVYCSPAVVARCEIVPVTEEIRLQIFRSSDSPGFPATLLSDGNSRLLTWKFSETPVKSCLKVTGTPVKTCWNFGSRNISSPISSVCGPWQLQSNPLRQMTKHNSNEVSLKITWMNFYWRLFCGHSVTFPLFSLSVPFPREKSPECPAYSQRDLHRCQPRSSYYS